MGTKDVGTKLVELCNQGKYIEAVDKLYAKDVVSIEAMENPAIPRVSNGFDAVRGKNEWWESNNEVHSVSAEGPYPNGDKFAVRFKFDVTGKAGPMAGQRYQMDEIAVYTVKDDKVVHEEFFYTT